MSRLVCHLIDANADTAYFRAIARRHDHGRFPVMIGSVSPAGALQAAMTGLGTPTFSLNASGRSHYPLALLRLVRLLRAARVQVLHAHCFDPTLLGLVAARLAGVAFVFTRHHSDHHLRLVRPWHTRVDACCGRFADRVIAVSAATKVVMTAVERVPAARIRVVPNGIEPLRPPAPGAVQRLRQELGIGDAPVVLMVARLHEEKGHRYLFQALPAIRARHSGTVVLLAGDGPHRAELARQVAAQGLAGVVHFLGQRTDVPDLIGAASVVVLPSLAESFGFAALEAMSAGKPVVVSRTGGLPEVVADGQAGAIVPQADAEQLAAAVRSILDSPARAQALGSAARTRSERFTCAAMVQGYEQVYEDLSRNARC
jgi:glycosyltransferase involved in cell wall biosynthesis